MKHRSGKLVNLTSISVFVQYTYLFFTETEKLRFMFEVFVHPQYVFTFSIVYITALNETFSNIIFPFNFFL